MVAMEHRDIYVFICLLFIVSFPENVPVKGC